MKKRPLKSQIPKQEFVQIKVKATDARQSLVLPKINYEISASVEMEEVFKGEITPLPTVLLYFLTHAELLVATTIMKKTNDSGECVMTAAEMAKFLKIAMPTVSTCLHSMRRAGLLLESHNSLKGNGRNRMLNYATIQHLNDLAEGEDMGVYRRIRNATRKSDILNMTKEDIHSSYDEYVLPPDHDPAEEEIYD